MSAIYRILRYPSRWALQAMADIRIEGADRIPASGPLILVPNHQSLADPFLVQSFCPRAVHSMTKSTQFSTGFFRWLVPRLHGFPVRRYRVDPQAVRVLLRLLDEGRVVCIYPEGERTWDGELQGFRRGALRVLLYAGVPIVPVGIHGMTHLWPRWLKLPRPSYGPRIPVTVRFGNPLEFGAVRDRGEREQRLPEIDRIIRGRLADLSRPRGASSPGHGGKGASSPGPLGGKGASSPAHPGGKDASSPAHPGVRSS